MPSRPPEFPNDNPLLWAIPEVAEPAPSIEFEKVVEVAVCADVEEDDDDDTEIEIVDELDDFPTDDAFATFVTTLAEVAASAGGADVATKLPALLAEDT